MRNYELKELVELDTTDSTINSSWVWLVVQIKSDKVDTGSENNTL